MSSHTPNTHQNLLEAIPFPWHVQQWAKLNQQKTSNQLAHAYLLQGDQGLGKKLFVERFALSILCLKKTTDTPCGECSVCLMAQGDTLPDFLIVAPEDNSRDIKIDQIRRVSDFVTKSSHAGTGKIVLIDKAHCLNNAAANALLKTLEEPSSSTFIFLVSDLPGALSATIRSRCQRILFSAPSMETGSQWLQQYLSAEPDQAEQISAFAQKPLLAFSHSEQSKLTNPALILGFLGKLLQSTSELRQATAAIPKGEELSSIGYLMSVSTILIKGVLLNGPPQDAESGAKNLYSQLVNRGGLEQQELAQRLLGYRGELVQARHQLLSGSNPNPQLIIESLLWHWSRLLN